MRIAADDRHSRLRQALFRPENMNDPLFDGIQIIEFNAEFLTIFAKRFDLLCRNRIFEWKVPVFRRNGMIDSCKSEVRASDLSIFEPQPFKRLRRSDFVDQVQIDVQKRRFVRFFVDEMRFPNFVVKRFHRSQTA